MVERRTVAQDPDEKNQVLARGACPDWGRGQVGPLHCQSLPFCTSWLLAWLHVWSCFPCVPRTKGSPVDKEERGCVSVTHTAKQPGLRRVQLTHNEVVCGRRGVLASPGWRWGCRTLAHLVERVYSRSIVRGKGRWWERSAPRDSMRRGSHREDPPHSRNVKEEKMKINVEIRFLNIF